MKYTTRAFILAPIVIVMGFTLRNTFLAVLQVAVGMLWLALALSRWVSERKDKP